MMNTPPQKPIRPSRWITTPIANAHTQFPFPFPHPPLFPPALPSAALRPLLSDPSSVTRAQLQAVDGGCLWRRINLLIYDLSNFAEFPPSTQRLWLLPDQWGDFFCSPYFTPFEGQMLAALPIEGIFSGGSEKRILKQDAVADGVDGKIEDDDADWEIVNVADGQEEEAPTPTAVAKPTTMTLHDAILHILSRHMPGSDYRYCAARQIASLLRRTFDIQPKDLPQDAQFEDLSWDSGTRLKFGEVWTAAPGQGDRHRKYRGNMSKKVANRLARKLESENDICRGQPCYRDEEREKRYPWERQREVLSK